MDDNDGHIVPTWRTPCKTWSVYCVFLSYVCDVQQCDVLPLLGTFPWPWMTWTCYRQLRMSLCVLAGWPFRHGSNLRLKRWIWCSDRVPPQHPSASTLRPGNLFLKQSVFFANNRKWCRIYMPYGIPWHALGKTSLELGAFSVGSLIKNEGQRFAMNHVQLYFVMTSLGGLMISAKRGLTTSQWELRLNTTSSLLSLPSLNPISLRMWSLSKIRVFSELHPWSPFLIDGTIQIPTDSLVWQWR